MTATIVVAGRAIARRRTRGIRKMRLLPWMLASFGQGRVCCEVQPGVPFGRHCRSLPFGGIRNPAARSQAATTPRFLQIVAAPGSVVPDQSSPKKDCQPSTDVHLSAPSLCCRASNALLRPELDLAALKPADIIGAPIEHRLMPDMGPCGSGYKERGTEYLMELLSSAPDQYRSPSGLR